MANNLQKLEKCTDDELSRKACKPALTVFTLTLIFLLKVHTALRFGSLTATPL